MTGINIKTKIVISALITLLLAMFLCVGCSQIVKWTKPYIGVANCNSDNYNNIMLALDKADGQPDVMPLIKYNGFKYENDQISQEYLDENGMLKPSYAMKIKEKPYDMTNVASVIKSYRGICFPGGEDIEPCLYKNPQPWYDPNDPPEFNPARDVSDYILMSYCLDNDIPVMAICRGMQMYAVVAGAEMIQDLPTYYASKGVPYAMEHQKSGEIEGKTVRGNHPVYVTDKNSYLYDCVKSDVIEKPYSSHHQAVFSVDPAKSKVTAVGRVNGVETIEALERVDSEAFGMFLQFHPEHALARWVNDQPEKESFMSYDTCLSFFKYFLDHI